MSMNLVDIDVLWDTKEGNVMAKTDTQISFRTTTEFKERLEAQAYKERRPVSNLISKVLEEYLDAQEKEAK